MTFMGFGKAFGKAGKSGFGQGKDCDDDRGGSGHKSAWGKGWDQHGRDDDRGDHAHKAAWGKGWGRDDRDDDRGHHGHDGHGTHHGHEDDNGGACGNAGTPPASGGGTGNGFPQIPSDTYTITFHVDYDGNGQIDEYLVSETEDRQPDPNMSFADYYKAAAQSLKDTAPAADPSKVIVKATIYSQSQGESYYYFTGDELAEDDEACDDDRDGHDHDDDDHGRHDKDGDDRGHGRHHSRDDREDESDDDRDCDKDDDRKHGRDHDRDDGHDRGDDDCDFYRDFASIFGEVKEDRSCKDDDRDEDEDDHGSRFDWKSLFC